MTGQHRFRIMPVHPDDAGMARIRMGRDRMRALGISSGDAVLVRGTRAAGAVCLQSDEGLALRHDPEFEYLGESGTRLPLARLSDLILHNAVGRSGSPVVDIERTEPVLASQVTLVVPDRVMYEAQLLSLHKIAGTVFTVGDSVQVQNTEKGARFPWIRFTVTEALPAGDAHVISEKTDIRIVPNTAPPMPRPTGPKRFVMVGSGVQEGGLEIILESLEAFRDCARLHFSLSQSFDDQMEWLENRVSAEITVTDDCGGRYRCTRLVTAGSTWSGGTRQQTSLAAIIVPAISPCARRLSVEIGQITWSIREKKDLQFLDRILAVISGEQTVVSIWQPQKSFHMIAPGPWRIPAEL